MEAVCWKGGTAMDKRSRIPALIVLAAATALLLPVSRDGDSPPVQDQPLPLAAVEVSAVVPTVTEEDVLPPVSEAPPEPPKPAEPWPESPRIADTYFDNAVFFGDSRTDGFRLYSGLDRGFFYYATGASVESVFTKAVETPAGEMPLLDALALMETPPERIFVMLGVNELGWAKSENFRNYYTQVIERLRSDHPQADVIVQSILPVSKLQEAKKTYVNNGRIADYNAIIRDVCGALDCPYLDVASAVADEEGFLRAEWTYDGVHLNKKGSAAWLEYLRTHAVDYQVYAPIGEEAPEGPSLPPENTAPQDETTPPAA